MFHRHRRGERGTTLLEAMIATAVLMIGAMGVATAAKVGVTQNADARKILRGTAIAQELVQQISLWRWDDVRLAAGTHVEADLGVTWPGLSSNEITDGDRYVRTWTVSYVDDLDGDAVWDAARVAVNVSWARGENAGNDSTRSVTLYTSKLNVAELR